jgi:hypothetical protein
MDPEKFRAYLRAEVGDRDADLITVDQGDNKGGRPPKGEENPSDNRTGFRQPGHDKAAKLRAILRSPPLVQDLYRNGLITQKAAARMGPDEPTPEQAGRVAEARQELERLDRSLPPREFRAAAKEAVARVLGSRDPSPLDLLRRAWAKASDAQRAEFLAEVEKEVALAPS